MARNTGQELFARCASGFEDVLAQELKGLGIRRTRPLVGGVTFFGSLEDAYRACLWSRVATRIQLVLSRMDSQDAEALYAACKALPWEEQVPSGATIAVSAHGQNQELRNTKFTALKVKDAICDRLRDERGSRPNVDAKNPDFSLDVSVHERKATLYLNLSGESLHRRGYRMPGEQTEAPLKETLAAGILLKASWDELALQGGCFADPMCGSGTLAIEAALIEAGIAPGMLRTFWGFQGWLGHDPELWATVRQEAELTSTSARSGRLRIVAGDLDSKAIGIARANARRAGVDSLIQFAVADASSLGDRLRKLGRGSIPSPGLLATNPPYGYRLQSSELLPETYAALAQAVFSLPEGWRMAAITPDPGLDTALGQTASHIIPCYNGPLKTTLRLYDRTSPQRDALPITSLSGKVQDVPVAEKNSEQFAARLRKIAKERAKWARKAGVSCYRIYDADLPDYALSVDLYQGAGPNEGQRFARVAEHLAPASVDADRAARRLSDAVALVTATLDLERSHVVVLPAREEKGSAKSTATTIVQVEESGHSFEVNLSARHDTGLSLDHRATRALLGTLAQGRRFCSLNAYAGAPTVYAAAGGALQTTTVDPSKLFLGEAQRTLERNAIMGPKHHLVCSDIRTWLKQAHPQRKSYDLIFCDLLAFAETHESERPFDPLRDHVSCLALVASVLAPKGSILLTSSLRTLRLDFDALKSLGLNPRDITAQTIPHDFARTPKIHRAWILEKA